MNPTVADPDSLTQVAAWFLERGQLDAAESTCRAALRADAKHLGALNVLAVVFNAQGRHARAADLFAELARRDSAYVDHWVNLGTALLAEGRHEEALVAYAEAGARGAASADFFYNVGLLHIAMGSYEAARTVLKDAVRLAPDDAEICYQYAVSCDETMAQDEAVRTLTDWSRLSGLTTELVAKIGLLLMNLGEVRSAELALERALQDPAPDDAALLRIVQILERTNRLDAARAALARLKASANAKSFDTDLAVIEARLADRDGDPKRACAIYRGILADTAEFRLRHYQLFPLAKSLDALARYEEAFVALEEAHRSQMAYMKLAVPDLVPKGGPPLKTVDFGCDADDFAQWDDAGAPPMEESPIFIVGFPRSGTTLLEQALDANPALRSMDETRYLHAAIDRMVDDGIDYPGKLAPLTNDYLDELRDEYWSNVRRRVSLVPGQRLVDKNPMNLLGLPAICRLFPNARIVLALRHPCDVMLSCFMQHFRAFQFTYLCRDLPTLALGYRRAFDFWYRETAVLKPTVLESRYETLVTRFEPQVRAIADFLRLPWTDAMLEPGEHARRKGFISTPSYTQVVQPVNTRSVGRWRSYERHFLPVIPQISPYLERWDYGA